MTTAPKGMYFNEYICTLNKIRKDKKYLDQIDKNDRAVLDEKDPSLFDYLCYMLFYIGNVSSPVYTYFEFKHCIDKTFDQKINKKKLYKKILLLLCIIIVYGIGNIVFEFNYIYTSYFGTLNMFKRFFIMSVLAATHRSKYYFGWVMGEIPALLGNIRCSDSNYEDYIRSFDVKNVELKTSPRKRIKGWNISSSKWLRICFYEKLLKFNFKKSRASMCTFAISAFWHGVYPSYYLCFILVHYINQIEKVLYKNPSLFFFPLFYNIFFDYALITFKAIDMGDFYQHIKNTYDIFILIIAYYILLRYWPKIQKKINKISDQKVKNY